MLKILGIVVGSIVLFFTVLFLLMMFFRFMTITFELIVEVYKIWRKQDEWNRTRK